jgi:hypothetical protein
VLVTQAAGNTLVTEPDQGLGVIYSLINAAQHTIDITMYELDDPTFEQDLANRVAAGVAVRVILDQNLEGNNNQAAYAFLSQNGVAVHWANPVYAATHQKSITIDGAQTAILTLNLTPRYYSTDRDFAIIDSDLNDVSAIEGTFQADFTNSAIAPALGDDLVWSPTNSEGAILGLINSAQKKLQVENEEMSDRDIVNALASAARRGVDVQITMTNTAGEYASEWSQLTAAGAGVSTYLPDAPLYIHAKVILADNLRAFVGSENFSSASLTRNREVGLIVSDSEIVASLNATLASDFLGGTRWPGEPRCPNIYGPHTFGENPDVNCRGLSLSAAACAPTACVSPSRSYPPSSTETRRPPAYSPAMASSVAVKSAKSWSVKRNLPSGSPRRESNPAEIITSSGRNSRMAGTSLCSNAPRISVRPEPARNGQFMVVPAPAASPVSFAAPVPGYQGDWWVLKKNTEPSA